MIFLEGRSPAVLRSSTNSNAALVRVPALAAASPAAGVIRPAFTSHPSGCSMEPGFASTLSASEPELQCECQGENWTMTIAEASEMTAGVAAGLDPSVPVTLTVTIRLPAAETLFRAYELDRFVGPTAPYRGDSRRWRLRGRDLNSA